MKKFKATIPTKTSRPKIGDVFFGEDAFTIGRPKYFDLGDGDIIEVSLTEKQCIKKTNKIETMFSKGKVFQWERTVETSFAKIDESRSNSTWLVEFVEQKDSLELIHSILPESYLIRARKLKDSKFDPEGEVIEFYTCGRFENTYNGQVEVIGKIS